MIGIIIMTAIAFLFGLGVTTLYGKTHHTNYMDYLPGYNCGTCGFGSCKGMCEAMEKDIQNYKKCKPLRGKALEKMEQMVEEHSK